MAAKQVNITHPQENINNIFEKNEIGQSCYQNSRVKFESNDSGEMNVTNNHNHNRIARCIEEQVELDPHDIKHEPLESLESDDESDDNSTSQSHDNESIKPSHPKKRKRLEGQPEVVKTIPNKCYICDTILESKSATSAHLGSHKHMLPYKCLQCSTDAHPAIYTTVFLINRHFESHGFNYLCEQCPLKFRSRMRLLFHVKTVHNERKLECQTCGDVFPTIYAFEMHTTSHKNVMTGQYKCKSCQTHFSSRKAFLKHHVLSTKYNVTALELVCKIARKLKNKRFKISERDKHNSYENLYSNMEPGTNRDETVNQSKNEANCVNNGSIDRAERRRKSVKLPKSNLKEKKTIPNKCYICNIVRATNLDLIEHLERHSNMLPYACSDCNAEGKPFEVSSLLELNKHFETHGLSYVCPHCPLQHRTLNSHLYHIQNGHRDKKFEHRCEISGKVFNSYNAYYNYHIGRRNLMEQRYKCEPCQKLFSAKHYLEKHKASFKCVRNTEMKSRRLEKSKSQSLLSIGKSEDEETFENEKQEDSEILIKKEVDEGDTQSSTVQPVKINKHDIVGSIPEQIKQEPIDIKDEPQMEDEEIYYYKNNDS